MTTAPLAEIATAVAEMGWKVSSWQPLHRFAADSTRRGTYLAVLDSGVRLKARLFPEEGRAAQVEHLLSRLEGLRLPRSVGRRGRVLMEEWLAGEPFPQSPGRGDLESAARLLASIHSIAPHPESPMAESHIAHFGERLQYFETSGRVSRGQADKLRDVLKRAPEKSVQGILQGDFCAENLLLDCDGEVWSVDNEGLAVDALDFDLGLAWYRWPMPRAQWEQFLETYYGSYRRPRGDLQFWKCLAVLKGLWVHSLYSPQNIERPMSRLQHLWEQE